ncbi:MAG: hypothetical protein AB8H03_25635 [Saprospiraceae bacterium]
MTFLNTKYILFIICLLGQLHLFGAKVSIKVFLEGPYQNGVMSDDLRNNGLIPLIEPYSSFSQFNHINGGGGETMPNSVLNTTGNNAIVDWVFVELRNGSNPDQVLFTRSALLQRDGNIVDTDGISVLNFSNAPSGNYFIVVRHRNHLAIGTNNFYSLNNFTTTVNFTNSSSIAFGNNALKNINGTWAMYAADTNRSGSINTQDRDLAWNQRSFKGYFNSDANMNGVVDSWDRGLAWNNRNTSQQLPTNSSGQEITITVTFANSISNVPNIEFTKFRFNKDFAYSLTLDDGNVNDINVVYPMLSGGTTPDGQTHVGHFYTDGCGNNQEFRVGFSIMGNHTFDVTNGLNFMSWPQVNTLLQAGWDLFNHSFDHCAYGCDYDAEVLNNVSIIESKTGFKPTHFAVPSGDDEGYTVPAFANGMTSVSDQNYLFPGNGGLEILNQMNLYQFRLHRNTLEQEATPYGNDIDNIAAVSQSGNKYWFSEYAHKIGYPNQSYVSVDANDFKNYMNYIENNYGRFGSDRVWFAPMQEVYEYLAVKQNVQILNTSISNNQLVITLNLANVPNDLRRNNLTLLLDGQSTPAITNVQSSDANLTFNNNGLINLSW